VKTTEIWPIVYRQTTKAVGGFANAFCRPLNKICNVLFQTSCLSHSFLKLFAPREGRIRFTTRLHTQNCFVKKIEFCW